MIFIRFLLVFFILGGCVNSWQAPDSFIYMPVNCGAYTIATWQKISSPNAIVHIYIEGDGHAFDSRGYPTDDPTPRGKFLRDIAISDTAPNVVYMARPCQFIMSEECKKVDWTTGRFSSKMIETMSNSIKSIAQDRPVILIGYSGGALVSGLIINTHPEIKVKKWVTIAGVLNHSDWTDFFGDSKLSQSMDLDELPNVPQVHYAAKNDEIVPIELTNKWVKSEKLVVIPDASHDSFEGLKIDFSY